MEVLKLINLSFYSLLPNKVQALMKVIKKLNINRA